MGGCFSSNLDPATEKLIDTIEDNIDTQTKLQFKISVDKIEEFCDDAPSCPKSFCMDVKNEEKQPVRLDKVEKPALPLPYPIHDEDWPNAGFLEALGAHFLNDAFDLVDTNKEFPDDKEERNKIVSTFLETRLKKIYAVFRNANVGLENYDLPSDKGISLMAFGGAGCQYMRGLDKEQKEDAEVLQEFPDCAFIHDVTFLSAYEVRKGFEKYGAAAYFNDKYEVIGIYSCALDKIFKPGDGMEWEHAKWGWRATLVTQVTFYDHLLRTHMVEAQSLVIPTRECLPFDHPLRRFLKPHCFRTIYINHKTLMNLAGEDQLLNRVFALPYKNVIKAMVDLYNGYKFTYLTQQFSGRGMDAVPDEIYPITKDMNEFWGITHKYVKSYIALYWDCDDALNNDEFIPLWWKELVGGSIKRQDLVDQLTVENIVDVLTQFICNGTVWHQFAGNAQEYLKYPDWGGSKLRPGAVRSDIQGYVQAMTIGILTGVPMPDLMNDWTFVLLDDDKRDQSVECMNQFQLDLAEMSKRVEEDNKKRRMPFKFCDPRVIDVSLGI